ncbi:MAG: acyl-CoA thioesterase [Novosphingobium sp.]
MSEDITPQEQVSRLLDLLNVETLGPDTFRGRRKIGGVGRVFGGQVIAQALVSAERTVDPDREVHSLHAYFLRGGSEDHEIDFAIARDFDGGSFSNRRVVASQEGTPILNLTASFHKREPGVHHAEAMPHVAMPDALLNEQQLRDQYIHMVPENMRKFVASFRALEIKPTDPMAWAGMKAGEPRLDTWFRAPSPLPDDPRVHRAVLAYATDYSLLGTCTVPHRLSWMTGKVQGASLDHAIWFHDDFRADEWLLYSTDSPWAGRARGFNRGRIYTQDGRLIAETAQEGLIRVRE